MCGFVGIASVDSVSGTDWLSEGCDSLAHRGPDDAGIWWSKDNRVGLGHRRLSILDLSRAGHQPMHYAKSECTIVYNGEIYNYNSLRAELIKSGYSFNSTSDTEVILAAYHKWGLECLERLRGMFAFAIYDPEKSLLFVARDRAGEKPLFYNFSNGTFKFGSELKCILSDNSIERNINSRALDTYLSMGYITHSDCILFGFNKLPAGYFGIFDIKGGTFSSSSYWETPRNLTFSKSMDDATDDELVNELEVLLEKSVNEQLIADVPVGILLSGGVDPANYSNSIT